MVTEIDGLSLALDADFSALDRAFAGLDKSMADLGQSADRELGTAFDGAARRMEGALARFARNGEYSFSSLKSAGVRAASDILSSFLELGLGEIGLGGGFSGGGVISGLVSGLFGRASGGPVSPGVPYMVGERGPELFLPRTPGRIARNGAAGPHITINLNGVTDGPGIRQSAGQVAAAVATAVRRGERNL